MSYTEGRGTITRQFTVWCFTERLLGRVCGCWCQTDEANTIRQAAQVFKARGWVWKRSHGWRCPGCVCLTETPGATSEYRAHDPCS